MEGAGEAGEWAPAQAISPRVRNGTEAERSVQPVCLPHGLITPDPLVRIHRCNEGSQPVGGLSVGLTQVDGKLDPAEGPRPLWLSLIGLENTGVFLK